MLPGKCRSASGRVAANVNCGLHLVIQPSSLPERNRVDLRLNKDAPSFPGRLLQHDLERNYSSRQGDRVISPSPRGRPTCMPATTNVADFCGLDVRSAAGSITPFGESPSQLSAKFRARQGCHSAGATASAEHMSLVSSSMPAFPILQRSTEEKILYSDRLTLERQKLTVCPVIDGEEHLRLLNFQHNFITRIQNISNLQRLIFLDLYDNQIEEIGGLSTLRSLRVLLLGKNRIKRISNLENLKNLDVLDLHGNQITKIENVNHLSDLRVLNLARNLLSHVDNLNGLESLTELNLRHNQITFVRDVDALPSLQRLFLSFNNISSFDSVCCLAESSSLSDISFDGNPIAQESWYKHTVLQNMTQLRQLDMKRVTEEERRVASVVAKKEEEKKRESQKQSLLKEKRRLTISNIARKWEQLLQRQGREAFSPNRSGSPQDPAFLEEPRTLDSLQAMDTHLVEVEGDTLWLYGAGALECLDRSWSLQTASAVTTICFAFMEFDEIVQALPKLRMRFPNSLHLKFKETRLVMLQQFNALAQLRRIDQLTIDPQGNPVVSFTLWKYYVLFRLSHFSLQKINGTEVTQNDMIMAERLFGILAHVASSELPQYRLISILGDARKKQFRYLMEAKGRKPSVLGEDNGDSKRLGTENTNRSTLNYTTRHFYNERLEETEERKRRCRAYTEGLVREAASIHTKAEALQKLWPQMFVELVRDAVLQMHNQAAHRRLCLQRLAHK